MAGRFNNPFPQFMDATPELYANGKLYFYASGTSTPLNTYTTKTLAVANANPIVLNAAGRPAVDIFLQDLEYKVVLEDANSNVIWTADPVSHRDSLLVAKTITGSGSPNGTTAGTAGSSSVLPDFYWDYTNQIYYVCTTTGTSSTAVWTAINASSSTASVPPPQGRLTLGSGLPILTSDVTSASTVYYSPFVGNQAPLYNGSTMVPTEFSELSLSLVANHALNTIYDVFLFSNSGVLTLVTGPSWSSSAAGAGSRGTGAGTTQLTRVKGFIVNAVQLTGRNGSTTYTVGANLGTYLGSILIDGTAGQVTCNLSYGQSRKWGVWNAYNRVPIVMKAGDSTASWAYTTNTARASNGSSANSISVFCGLAEETVTAEFSQYVQGTGVTATSVITNWVTGIGWNSTTAFSGQKGTGGLRVDQASNVGSIIQNTSPSRYIAAPSLGLNTVTSLEQTTTAGGGGGTTVTYNGTEASMLLTTRYTG